MSRTASKATNQHNSITITLQLDLDWPLVEDHTQGILSSLGLDVTDFTPDEISEAWTETVRHYLERAAEDSDSFLRRNGTDERFLQTLLDE